MCALLLLLAGFAYTGHGRRVPRLEQTPCSSFEASQKAGTRAPDHSHVGRQLVVAVPGPWQACAGLLLAFISPAVHRKFGASCARLNSAAASMWSHVKNRGGLARLQMSELRGLKEFTRRGILVAAFAAGFTSGRSFLDPGQEVDEESTEEQVYQDEDLKERAMLASARGVVLDGMERGMAAFAEGGVGESIRIFDELIDREPSAKLYLWQRGVSLYYADRFREGAEQFATDGILNNKNAEECVWHLMCLARLQGLDAARKQILTRFAYKDDRPVMRVVLKVFAGETSEDTLERFALNNGLVNEFYGSLYLGLYREARGDADGARSCITAAVNSAYGQQSGNYMASVAQVHKQVRGW